VTPHSPDIRVAVVEDRHEELETLVAMLRSAPGFACVAACSSAQTAVTAIPPVRPDVVLMDIQMPEISGIECVRELRPLLPQAQIMMLTVVEDHDLIFRSLAAGANGYLLKKTPVPRLLEAIAELHSGGAPMSGQIARKVVATFRQQHLPTSSSETLSATEQDVLKRLARGLLYKEVAAELGMSVSTVRTHVWHVYRKLQVHNRTEAILKGLPRSQP
jgi:DNA-binding NarL/FixJ family response regulator